MSGPASMVSVLPMTGATRPRNARRMASTRREYSYPYSGTVERSTMRPNRCSQTPGKQVACAQATSPNPERSSRAICASPSFSARNSGGCRSWRAISATEMPRRSSADAAAVPATPAPRTATSTCIASFEQTGSAKTDFVTMNCPPRRCGAKTDGCGPEVCGVRSICRVAVVAKCSNPEAGSGPAGGLGPRDHAGSEVRHACAG